MLGKTSHRPTRSSLTSTAINSSAVLSSCTTPSPPRLNYFTWRTGTSSSLRPHTGLASWVVQYYRGKKGSIEATDAPYPNVGKSEVQAYLPPFRLVAPRKWPESGVKRDNARTESRERLAVLVKFAFLLTGRIHRVTSDDVGDQLSKFGELCAFIEDTEQAQDQVTHRKEKDKEAENAEEDESTDGSTTDTTDASSADSAVPVRSSKRVASSPESNEGVYAEPAVDERSKYPLYFLAKRH